jgi:hypothetical protein
VLDHHGHSFSEVTEIRTFGGQGMLGAGEDAVPAVLAGVPEHVIFALLIDIQLKESEIEVLLHC